MFSTGGKKRGSAFHNPEPSSPKVTCIGQVRIKTKKQGSDKIQTLSKRMEGVNLAHIYQTYPSNQFHQQKCVAHRNQRWVHLPLTICEALRAIGAEFSCLFPRHSVDKKENAAELGGSGRSSCTAVFGRWLAAVQHGEREEEKTEVIKQSNLRKHILDGIEIDDEKLGKRLSTCIPPKNALLIMRYRSDPTRISNLTNRLMETTVTMDDDDDDDDDDDEENDEEPEVKAESGDHEQVNLDECDVKDGLKVEEEETPEAKLDIFEELQEEIQESEVSQVVEDENLLGGSCFEANVAVESEEDGLKSIQETEKSAEEREKKMELGSKPVERESEVIKQEREGSVLPDSLMMMMCERVKREKVKLSMEVSRETWICRSDFMRLLPERKVKIVHNSDEPKKKVDTNSNPSLPPRPAHHKPLQQPPRSSFSYPAEVATVAGVSVAAKAMAYGPFILTRCKSEPMRTPAKLDQETCSWNNVNLEPHRGAKFGIGEAGVGF